jgi:hypothetical protein
MTSIPDNQTEKIFTFAEVVHGRDSSVRVTDDGLLYAVDLVMVVTGHDQVQSTQILRRLSNEMFHQEKLLNRPSVRGGHSTKLITIENAIELIMILPGKKAKKTRAQFAEIIKRYLAGDKSLIIEINANTSSTSPINQLAKVSMGKEVSFDTPYENCTGIKRRHKEVDGVVSMEFVEDAFELQKEVLGLRNGDEISTWEKGNQELVGFITENDLLRKENQEAMKIISDLEEELKKVQKEQQDITEELDEAVKTFIILGKPHVSQANL